MEFVERFEISGHPILALVEELHFLGQTFGGQVANLLHDFLQFFAPAGDFRRFHLFFLPFLFEVFLGGDEENDAQQDQMDREGNGPESPCIFDGFVRHRLLVLALATVLADLDPRVGDFLESEEIQDLHYPLERSGSIYVQANFGVFSHAE